MKTEPNKAMEPTPVSGSSSAFAKNMRFLTNRWFFLLVGFLLGGCLGSVFWFHFAVTRIAKYDRALQDHFVDSRAWNIMTATATLQKLDSGDIDSAVRFQEHFMQGAFMALGDLHKSGQYS